MTEEEKLRRKREYDRQWKLANRDKVLAARRRYTRKYPDKIKAKIKNSEKRILTTKKNTTKHIKKKLRNGTLTEVKNKKQLKLYITGLGKLIDIKQT